MTSYYLGVDVGTGSARAGLFDASGTMLASAKRDITIWREAGSIVEQSSANIWQAVCESVREAVKTANVDPTDIAGIGYDATCSLVVLGEGGKSLAVGPSNDPARDIIVWMDHRAVGQAERINATKARVLDYIGSAISPEMETPKLLWLKENKPETFAAAWQFFDLTDFLTWKSCGSLARSACTVTCKWTYLSHEKRWDETFFREVGLGELADENFVRIGTDVRPGGESLGGLSEQAAAELGLMPGTAIAAGLIDAHAGGIGTVGARGPEGRILSRMAYVFGTSACTMTTTEQPVFVDGVWGPYYSAMVPGLWLNEGGQSAAGAAIDHLIHMHPFAKEAEEQATAQGKGLVDILAAEVDARGGSEEAAAIIGDIHVVPEFLGNRAPFADPDARAIIAGLDLDAGIDSLTALYLAGLCGLGYGARQIVEAQKAKGIATDTIVVSGGAARSHLVRQVLADTTGLVIAASTSPEPVLLGSAMLGAVASGAYPDLASAMDAMSELGEVNRPDAGLARWHDQRFEAFTLLQATARKIRVVQLS
ncbi:FGGY-family carbohydrate kinase [Brucella anthropi]|uniref:FGGY-family carbohydrate kinase n=1 Tax=Brucella anthropi TaxID=529 RepID=UPI00124BDF62|nr:FGGY-family carbohydrate kinase [Brucella anthropi]KAB2768197.1 FGGY-family carbohydrate kinase [Brucella anthropi]